MTKDDVIRLAREAQVHEELTGEFFIHEFAKLVAEHSANVEREECAKVCYELMLKENPYDQWNGMKLCMEAIQARGEK